MKQILLSLSIIAMITSCRQQPIDVDTNYDEYPKTDASLWLDYAPERTVFKLWSPVAKAVKLRLYENGHDEAAIEIHDMQVGEDYVWTLEVAGDLNGRYYTYQVLTTDGPLLETPGIY
ncbi:MAG: hypothetical protein KJP00_04220, partial [Bacteroidia bacterium]|nr:hypothetical protein [Bacteroidia bacterium]